MMDSDDDDDDELQEEEDEDEDVRAARAAVARNAAGEEGSMMDADEYGQGVAFEKGAVTFEQVRQHFLALSSFFPYSAWRTANRSLCLWLTGSTDSARSSVAVERLNERMKGDVVSSACNVCHLHAPPP